MNSETQKNEEILKKDESSPNVLIFLTFLIVGALTYYLYSVKKYNLAAAFILSNLVAGIFGFIFINSASYYKSRPIVFYTLFSSLFLVFYAYWKAFTDFRVEKPPIQDDGF